MGEVKKVMTSAYDDIVKSFVDRATELSKGNKFDKREALGMFRVLNVMELINVRPIQCSNGMVDKDGKEIVRDGATLIPVPDKPEDFICTDGLDGMYGNTLDTVGDLRSAMSELDDDDQITLVTIDTDTGDEQDHYPMHLDVIGGIELTTGQVVNEVQFVQERNCEPDTRDKQPVVDALIDVVVEDANKGDTTVIDELLLRMPFNVLKYALPEDMWADFESK